MLCYNKSKTRKEDTIMAKDSSRVSINEKKSKKPNYVKVVKDDKMSRWDRGGDCIAPASKKYVPKKG